MARQCDHCRKTLGPSAESYWRMQFCSADCVKGYQCRLEKNTLAKIRLASSYDAILIELPEVAM
jgi:hypothetical protein